jgi:hypothetical protein
MKPDLIVLGLLATTGVVYAGLYVLLMLAQLDTTTEWRRRRRGFRLRRHRD